MGDGLGVPKQFQLGPGAAGANVNEFDIKTSVAAGQTITVVTYPVPVDKTFYLTLVEFFGENIADYKVYIDGVKQAQKSTYFGGKLSGDFFFNNLAVAAEKVVRLDVTNFRSESSLFTGRILGGTA